MKRHGNLWPKIIDINNIYHAYLKARKGKGWQNTIKKFDKHFDRNLFSIQESLVSKTFTTASYKKEIIYEPKKRIIYKLPFNPDRIVQHSLMRIVEPFWDNLFIYDSYSCRKGKGIHAGSKRIMEFVRKNKYCLKLDIRRFYPSISHDILYKIIKRKIKCKDSLWLIKNIIYSISEGINIPIGNYTSQWFGNLYMNELDQFLKHKYKVKYYIRYCDDFCLFHNSKIFLRDMTDIIKTFLLDKLNLSLSKCDLFPVSRGVDFLGYRHFPKYILLRKSTTKRVRRRLEKLPILLERDLISIDQYRSSLASTCGWLKWANAYHLYKKLKIDELKEILNYKEKLCGDIQNM